VAVPQGYVNTDSTRRLAGPGAAVDLKDNHENKLAFTRYSFYFESFVHEPIVLSFLPPTCIAHTVAILLHDYRAI